jgi:ribose transport system substrate-binding protein
MEKMQEVIDQGVAFDVVFGGNDPTALGALAAMQKNHAGKGVLLYGIDGSPAGKAMIKKGYMEGSSAQFPLLMAQQAAKMAYDLLDKKPIDQLVYVPVQLITKENIDKFDFTGWQ